MFPDNLKYSRSHLWARVKGEKVVIGVTEQFTEKMTEIHVVTLPKKGEDVDQDEIFGSIEADDQLVDLVSPVSGEVLRMNSLLRDEPGILIDDPYGDGWLIEIDPYDPEEMESLLTAEEYENEAE